MTKKIGEFTITIRCPSCGSTDCEQHEDYWDDGDFYGLYCICNCCGEDSRF